jgi:hypothetical protein
MITPFYSWFIAVNRVSVMELFAKPRQRKPSSEEAQQDLL